MTGLLATLIICAAAGVIAGIIIHFSPRTTPSEKIDDVEALKQRLDKIEKDVREVRETSAGKI